MKNAKQILLVLFLVVLGMVATASANTIFLSGDSNIGNAIDGSNSVTVNLNNATFFSNVLGSGTNVKMEYEMFGFDTSISTSLNSINTYYNSLPGVTSSLSAGGLISNATLAGVDLYFSANPADNYQASEITALSSFLNTGGSLFLLGDWYDYGNGEYARINSLLASLGSSMSLGTSAVESSYHITSNIIADPYTTGVNNFTFAYTNIVSGGNPLILTVGQQPFIAYESEITAPIPEPATMFLLGTGLVGVAGAARRKKKNQA